MYLLGTKEVNCKILQGRLRTVMKMNNLHPVILHTGFDREFIHFNAIKKYKYK